MTAKATEKLGCDITTGFKPTDHRLDSATQQEKLQITRPLHTSHLQRARWKTLHSKSGLADLVNVCVMWLLVQIMRTQTIYIVK